MINESSVLRAIFIRHGQTAYTNIFPDLTDEGKQTIIQSAHLLKKIFRSSSQVSLCSSPAMRAQGSASILAKEFDYKDDIHIIPEIAPFAFINVEEGMKLLQEYIRVGGLRAVEKAYSKDECFEDANIFEPRSVVKNRFFGYLKKIFLESLQSNDVNKTLVHVSHFECLHHLADRFIDKGADNQTLENGEVVVLDLIQNSSNNGKIILSFRQKQKIYMSLQDFFEMRTPLKFTTYKNQDLRVAF